MRQPPTEDFELLQTLLNQTAVEPLMATNEHSFQPSHGSLSVFLAHVVSTAMERYPSSSVPISAHQWLTFLPKSGSASVSQKNITMKTKPIILRLFIAVVLGLAVTTLQAQNEKKKVAGPNGGRVVTGLEPRAEFLVMGDRKVKITFLGKDGKPVAPAEQVVTVTSGDRAAPTQLTFTKSGNALVSNVALPAGDELPTVVQIKPTPSGKTVIDRFTLDLSKCGECKLAEYACICAH